MNHRFIDLEEGELCLNTAQVQYVKSKCISGAGVKPREFEYTIYLAGKEEPITTYGSDWFSTVMDEHLKYQIEAEMENEHQVRTLLWRIANALSDDEEDVVDTGL